MASRHRVETAKFSLPDFTDGTESKMIKYIDF